jgi:DNA repair exonuclease SbcCD ATPase subunit
MADNEVVIGVRSEGTQETSAELRQVAQAEREIGQAGQEAAGGTQAFTEGIDAAVEAITSSGAALEEQRGALETVRQELESNRTAYEGNAESLAAIDGAISRVNDRLGELEAVAGGASNAAQSLTSGFDGVDRALANVQKQTDTVNQKLASGSKVSRAEIDKITAAEVALEREIRDTGKAVEELGPEFKRALDTAQAEAEGARRKFVDLDQAMGKTRRTLNDTGASWRGFGAEAQDALGPAGAALGRLTLAVTVFTTAFKATQSVLRSMGVDFREQDAVLETLKERLLNTGGAMRDAFSAAIRGDVKAMTTALHESDAALGMNSKTLETYRQLVNAGVLEAGNFRDKQEELRIATELYNTAQGAGTQGLTLWNNLAKQHNGDLNAFIAALKASEPALVAYAEHVRGAAEASKAIAAAQREVIAEAEKQIAQEKKLADSLAGLQKNQALVTQSLEQAQQAQSAAQAGMIGYGEAVQAQTLAVSQAEDAHRAAKEEVDRLTAQYGAGAAVVQEAITKEQQLAQHLGATRDRLEETRGKLSSAQTAYGDATTAADTHRQKLSDLEKQIGTVATEQGKLSDTLKTSEHWALKAAEAIGKGEGSLAKVYEALSKSEPAVTESTKRTTTAIEAQAKATELLNGQLERLTKNMPGVVQAMNALEQAAASAAGEPSQLPPMSGGGGAGGF